MNVITTVHDPRPNDTTLSKIAKARSVMLSIDAPNAGVVLSLYSRDDLRTWAEHVVRLAEQ